MGLLRGAGQVVRELEENLGSIEEVTEAVKIVHSYAVMSLNFLKNLRVIRGENLIKHRSVLYLPSYAIFQVSLIIKTCRCRQKA